MNPTLARALHTTRPLGSATGAATAHLLAATLTVEPPTYPACRMPAERATLPIGAYLLGYGYLRPQQLVRALREQRETLARHQHLLLGDILIDQGLISPRVLATLMAVQLVDRLIEPAPFQPERLGELLVARGRLQPVELAGALQWQAWLRSKGLRVRLGEILVQQNLVTAPEVEALVGSGSVA